MASALSLSNLPEVVPAAPSLWPKPDQMKETIGGGAWEHSSPGRSFDPRVASFAVRLNHAVGPR